MAWSEDLPPAWKFHWWQRQEWIDRRTAVLIAVGCLEDEARSQAEGEWRIRKTSSPEARDYFQRRRYT